ncbi:unnamed protein product [Phytomonas sp. Hart1]|nr:unnamed protein product [Phytomonas sp. Hart1]|eukprot:CCW66478.1 unnamed protein product [Phytomonas sp. isolate Hart1]
MSINSQQTPIISHLSCNSLEASLKELRNIKQRQKPISKREVRDQIQNDFKVQQKMKRDRQLHSLVLGKGLGEVANKMIFKGFYKPQMVFEDKDSNKQLDNNSIGLTNLQSIFTEISPRKVYENALGRAFSQSVNSASGLRPLDSHRFSNTYTSTHFETLVSTPRRKESVPRSITKFEETCAEIRDTIDNLESDLDVLCVPHLSFNVLLDILSRALELVEHGDLKEEFILSGPEFNIESTRIEVSPEGEATIRLVGAEEVMNYVLKNMIDTAFELVPVTHTAQWVLQFTITFLRSLTAVTEEDAYLRLGLLARCVRLLGSTEHFSATLLTFVFMIEEYDAFYQLTDSAESNIEALFSEVDSILNSVLMESFPFRRSKLQKVDRIIKSKLQRVITFINELDTSWRPTIYFHTLWKDTFLSKCFFRIHNVISQRYVFCSHGFVDEVLYSKIYDSRVTGRVLGTMPSQPQIVLARRVEYERVIEGLTYQQIGISVKRHSSLVVGYQICMSARFILRQATPLYDKAWGFKMDETSKDTDEDMDKMISKIVARAKKGCAAPNFDGQRATSVFITQEEDSNTSKISVI